MAGVLALTHALGAGCITAHLDRDRLRHGAIFRARRSRIIDEPAGAVLSMFSPPLRVVWRAHDLPMGLCGGVMKTGRGWRFYLARYIRIDITWFNKPAGVRKRVRLAAKPRRSDKPEVLLTERLIEESLAESVGGRAMNIGLVAASLEQAEGPQEAKRLYTSPLFHLSADYCRRHYHRWFILSWEHRLIHPEMVLLHPKKCRRVGALRISGVGPRTSRLSADAGSGRREILHPRGGGPGGLLLPVLDAAWPVAARLRTSDSPGTSFACGTCWSLNPQAEPSFGPSLLNDRRDGHAGNIQTIVSLF